MTVTGLKLSSYRMFLKVFLEIRLQREGSLPGGNFPGSNFPTGTTFQGAFFILGQLFRGHFSFWDKFPGGNFPTGATFQGAFFFFFFSEATFQGAFFLLSKVTFLK